MRVPHYTDTKLFRWLFGDGVLDLVESILGPDIALFGTHFHCKPKGDGKESSWHEDSSYWKTLIANAGWRRSPFGWAIDPSTAENGAICR